MKKRILSLLLALCLVAGLLPGVALAADSVTVTFSFVSGNEFIVAPQSVTVSAGLAASYGIGQASTSPTVLDAVVAAHKLTFGDGFTEDTASDYVNSTLSTIFGLSGFAGHAINGAYSGEYASSAVVQQGDVVDVFLYEDSSWSDHYIYFTQEGKMTRSIAAEASQPISGVVYGFNYMGAYSGVNAAPVSGLTVSVLDTNGAATTIPPTTTDENGAFTLTIDTTGDYLLAATGPANGSRAIPGWCRVSVAGSITDEERAELVSADKAALSLAYVDGESLTLPTRGASGKTAIVWTSSHPASISEKGKVVKSTEAVEVTLTATISCGSLSDTKEFTFTVPALTADEAVARMNAAKAALNTNSLKPTEYSGESGGSYAYESVAVDVNILTKAQSILDEAAPGVVASLPSDFTGNSGFEADGTILYPSGYTKTHADISFDLALGSLSDRVNAYSVEIDTHSETKSEVIAAEMAKVTLDTILNGQSADQVTSTLKLPAGSSFGVEITWSSNNPAVTMTLGTSSSTGKLHKIIRPAYGQRDAVVTLTATFDYADTCKNYGICDAGPMPENNTLTFQITVPASTDKTPVDALMESIAHSYVDSAYEWVVMDMAAYAAYATATTNTTSASAKQTYINTAIASLQDSKATDTTYSKAILALSGLGIDAQQLYPVNSNTPVNAITGLSGITQSTSAWSAPYTLAAYNQGDYEGTTDYETALVDALLAAQNKDDGSWDEWGTIDTTANAIAGLAFYRDDARVDAAIEKGVNYLASQMKDDGTFGSSASANSCAMVIVGLCAAGVNPDTDSRFVKNGVSALDGLLSFALADNSGFWYLDNTKRNEIATEQGFRALIAASQVAATGKAYNIYDFSLNAASRTPGRATGAGEVVAPSEPDTDQTITVYFTLKATDSYWIPRTAVTVKSGSTVYHAFTKACDDAGLTYVGAETGYVRSITKGDTTLGEFLTGDNSGWLYKVNGTAPNIGLTSCSIAAGDEIVWFFTNDWTKEEGFMVPTTSDRFTDIAASLYRTDILWAAEKGLFSGVSKTEFLPERAITRGQLATVLYRLAGSPASAGEGFTDIREGSYCAPAAAWAAKTGVALGFADGSFHPGAPISRQQLAVMLYRAAKLLGIDTTEGGMVIREYSDYDAISDYAKPAMAWCVNAGLFAGENGRIDPAGAVTRGEAAAILHRLCKDAK